MNEKLYSKTIDSLVDDGYIVINDVLSKELVTNLLNFSKKENGFKKAGISGKGDLHIDNNRRRDKILWLENDNSTQSEFLEFTNGLKEYLNRELYMGLTYYESHFAIYNEGDFYETHLDSFKNSKNRVVTTVFYLNDNWTEDDGGELIIYDENHNFLAEVLPKANTLVIFLSDKFPHEVKPAKRKRFSIAGWFRVDR